MQRPGMLGQVGAPSCERTGLRSSLMLVFKERPGANWVQSAQGWEVSENVYAVQNLNAIVQPDQWD